MADPRVRTYTCEGCGNTFKGTQKEAFEAGWDTPEVFMSHTTCSECTIDKTIWWKVVVRKEEPTQEELALLKVYNEIFDEHREMLAKEARK